MEQPERSALREQGFAAEAETAARRAVSLVPVNSSYLVNLSSALHSQGRNEEASEWLQLAVQHDDQYAVAWCMLGVVEQTLERFGAAEIAYQKSLALAPEFAAARANYANLLSERGQPQRALELLSA